MLPSAILWSILGGAAFYAYTTWVAEDRDDPRDARKMFRNWLGLLGFAALFVGLLLVPWAVYHDWSILDVVTGRIPDRKLRFMVYVVHGMLAACAFGAVHSLVAKFSARPTSRT